MSKANILVIEDDVVLNDQISDLLVQADYSVTQCHDGEKGLTLAVSEPFDVILLDVMLPGRDGFSLLAILRKSRQTPVIMVTAKGAEQERIQGLIKGADDYLAKPFNPMELHLRVEALLRRTRPDSIEKKMQLSLDGLGIDRALMRVTANEEAIDLTPIQFNLLWALILNTGEVLTKAYLYQTVLNRTYGAHDRSLDMHLSRVRRKLNEAGWNGERLQTVHGKGYCLK